MSASVADLSCANCGKGQENSSTLKVCSACKSVHYCGRDCQAAHHKQHKKACKEQANDLALFQDPPREDCPICMLPLPLCEGETSFRYCCGQTICLGCYIARKVDYASGKTVKDNTCPFCREPHTPDKLVLDQLNKLMEKGNGKAFNLVAGHCLKEQMGLVQDMSWIVSLNLKVGELGCADGYEQWGRILRPGPNDEGNLEKSRRYFVLLAAMKGSVKARILKSKKVSLMASSKKMNTQMHFAFTSSGMMR